MATAVDTIPDTLYGFCVARINHLREIEASYYHPILLPRRYISI